MQNYIQKTFIALKLATDSKALKSAAVRTVCTIQFSFPHTFL